VERQAALNLEFAAREAITDLGLDRTVEITAWASFS
jgi:hypothetical protein